MRPSPNSSAIVVAALVAVVLTALAWFFFLQPRMGATSDANAATELQVLTNNDLTVQLQKRKVDFEHLPELRAEVWEIRDQLPVVEDAAAVRDVFHELGTEYGLVVQTDSVGAASEVVPGLVLADAFAPYGVESYVDTLTFTGLSAVPLTVSTQGSYESVMAYLDELQVGDHRYFLISTLSLLAMAEDLSTNPPTHAGDVQLQASGFFFVLDHGVEGISERPAADPVPGSVPLPSEVVPAPSNDRNFLLPTE